MMIFKKAIPRRTFLRGLGTTLSLPLLDAMIPAFGGAAYAASQSPVRVGFVYMPNGRIMGKWLPATEGAGFEMTPILEPLSAFREDLLVLSGLSIKAAYPEGGHARSCAAFLTGIEPEPAGTLGVSVDQVMARQFGKETQLASLELGLDSTNAIGQADGQYAPYWMQTVSWRSPTTPLPTESNPRAVFERMFGDIDSSDPAEQFRRMKEQRSVLDSLTGEISGMLREVGTGDNVKLTEYLDATRDIERRIQVAEKTSLSDTAATSEADAFERPVGVPSTFEAHCKLMLDLQVLAYQTDLTRVISFMMGHEQTDRAYREIGISDGHHALSHHREVPEVVEQVLQINIYQSKMIAYLLDKMRSTPDGDGSLLDHSILMFGSALSDGNLHLCNDVPVLLAGGGSGRIKGGRHIRYPQPDTPLSNLHLTLMDTLGIPVEPYIDKERSDATGKLAPLSV